MLAKKRKLQAPASMMDEAPAFGGFPGVFLAVVAWVVVALAAFLVVAAPPPLAPVAF